MCECKHRHALNNELSEEVLVMAEYVELYSK